MELGEAVSWAAPVKLDPPFSGFLGAAASSSPPWNQHRCVISPTELGSRMGAQWRPVLPPPPADVLCSSVPAPSLHLPLLLGGRKLACRRIFKFSKTSDSYGVHECSLGILHQFFSQVAAGVCESMYPFVLKTFIRQKHKGR